MADQSPATQRSSLYDVELPVTVVVGHTTLSLNDLSNWGPDSIVALDVTPDEPIELVVNGKVVATGEFCPAEDGSETLSIRILDIKQAVEAA